MRNDGAVKSRIPKALQRSIVLDKPARLGTPSAWESHIPFAFWFTEVHRPRVFVELGTHAGNSYFAFVQAVKRLRLPSQCFAVDTWRGDEHAGYYGEDVFKTFSNYHDQHFSAFSGFIRSTFDDALSYFSDASVDLLHIDGCHTYEAVKHDFYSWLPKLSTAGVVLFHDTNVRENNFGVWKLWEELIADYPHFQFNHGHGLGILGVGKTFVPDLNWLFDLSQKPDEDETTIFVRSFFEGLGSALSERLKLNESLSETNTLRAERERLQEELSRHIASSTRLQGERELLQGERERLQEELSRHIASSTRLQGEREQLQEELSWQIASSARLQGEREQLQEELSRQTAKSQQLQAEVWQRRAEIDAIRGSSSWRVTSPLRTIATTLGVSRTVNLALRLIWWTITLQLYRRFRERKQLASETTLIANSGLFDTDWYLAQYPDVAAARLNPLLHYLRHGAAEGRDPNPLFDTDWYLAQYPDVATARLNPLLHYLRRGAAEGRDPNPHFDTDWYLAQYPDVAAARLNPLLHYLRHGAAEGRDPNPQRNHMLAAQC